MERHNWFVSSLRMWRKFKIVIGVKRARQIALFFFLLLNIFPFQHTLVHYLEPVILIQINPKDPLKVNQTI